MYEHVPAPDGSTYTPAAFGRAITTDTTRIQPTMGCNSKCPTCGKSCVGGLHPQGQHACADGHSW